MSELTNRSQRLNGGVSPSPSRSQHPARGTQQLQQKQQQRLSTKTDRYKEAVSEESEEEEEEDDDDDDDNDDDDEEVIVVPKKKSASIKKRKKSGFTVKLSLNFIQILVFATLMLQGLTLFVSYHMLLTTQQQHNTLTSVTTALNSIRDEIRTIRHSQSQYDTLLTEVQFLSRQVRAGSVISTGNVVAGNSNTNTNSNSGSNDDNNSNDANGESDPNIETIELDWLFEDGSVNRTLLESSIHELNSNTPDGPYPSPSYRAVRPGDVGGNHMMALRPYDLKVLFQFNNWTDNAENGDAFDAGVGHNQTHALLSRLAQIDSASKPVDVRVVELVRNERNMVTARDIKQGEYFFKIHEEYLLTSMVVQQSDVGQEIANSGYDAEDMVAMSVFILYEKVHAESYWKFWLNVLPTSYRHMPVTFDWVDELELIQGTSCLEWVLDYQVKYRKEYMLLTHHLSALNFSQFTFAQYIWARNVVASRAFGLDVYRAKEVQPEPSESDKANNMTTEEWELVHISCMSAADLINHEGEERKINAVWGWNEATREFAFKARRDLPAGSSLATTYGMRGNSDLLTHYGFTLADNPFDTAWMCINANNSDVQVAAKQQLIEDVFGSIDSSDELWGVCEMDQLPGLTCKFQNDLLAAGPQHCFQLARVSVASSAQFHEIYEVAHRHDLDLREKREKQIAAGEEVEPLQQWSTLGILPFDFNLEVRAVTRLGASAKRALRKFSGGPSAMDKAYIASSERAYASGECSLSAEKEPLRWFPKGSCLTNNQLNLLRVRGGEKEILERVVNLSKLVNEFVAENPATMAASFDFLRRTFPQPAELHELVSKDITPYFGALSYFVELFLPLHARMKGWEPPSIPPVETAEGESDAAPTAPTHPFEIEQALYRKYYWPDKSPEEQQLEDDRNAEYSYTEPGPSSPNYVAPQY